MINLFFIILLLAVIFLVGHILYNSSKQTYSFMSFEHTDILRGIAALIIMLQHLSAYYGFRYFTPLGEIGVAIFLILSGFGLNESYKKYCIISKTEKVKRKYWGKKILKVFLPYTIFESIAVLIFGLYSQPIWKFVLDITSIMPVYWYLQILLIFYISFYICTINEKIYKYKYLILGFTAILIFIFGGSMETEQSLSFFIGVFISDNIASVKRVMQKYKFMIVSFSVGIILLALKQIPIVRNISGNYIWYLLQIIMNIAFAFWFISITAIADNLCNNVFFKFMGKISYEFYLIHCVVLDLFKVYSHKSLINNVLLDIAFLPVSITISWLFNFLWGKISGYIINVSYK